MQKHIYLMKLIEAAIEDAEQTAGFALPIAVHLDQVIHLNSARAASTAVSHP